MGLFSKPNTSEMQARIARLERKVDAILAHLQIDVPQEAFPEHKLREAHALAAAGNKIGAIKLYRDLTGANLSDAMHEVESWK